MSSQNEHHYHPLWAALIVIALGVPGLRGVATAGEEDSSGAAPLEGTPWILQGLAGDEGQILPLVAHTEITLRFQGGRLEGSGGCNHYSATYEIVGDEIQLGPISSTRKVCPESEETMETEAGYLAALGRVARFEIRDARLTLLDAEGRRLAVFRVAPHESRAPGTHPSKLGFDLSMLDDQGMYGPPDGLRALDYEFCIPATQAHVDEVRAIDPAIRVQRAAHGRIACTEREYLCLGHTHTPAYREILHRLASLSYVRRIVQSHFE